MIFDTHAHYDSEQFDEDREILLASMKEAGVGMIVNVAASYESCFEVPKLAEKYPFMYAAVGVHPDEVGDLNEETFARMKEQFKLDKVVAVGEIGLDYYWDNEPHEIQKKWFIRQLDLARELDLPVMIHSRSAAARYHGDYERTWPGTAGDYPLLFVFAGNGKRVCENGLSHRHRWCGDIQEWQEAERSC